LRIECFGRFARRSLTFSALSAGIVLGLAGGSAYGQPPATPSAKASQLAAVGSRLLSSGEAAEARKYCEQAIQQEAVNDAAADCLEDVARAERQAAQMTAAEAARLDAAKIDAAIAEARRQARVGQSDKAADTLTAARNSAKTPEQLAAITKAFEDVGPTAGGALTQARLALMTVTIESVVERLTASWVFDIVMGLAVLAMLYGSLLLARWGRRKYRAFKTNKRRFGVALSTKWLLLPLDDKSELGVTELLVDAVTRLRKELKAEVEIPTLLPIRPTVGEPHEAQVWKDFRIDPPQLVRDIESDVAFKVEQHVIELADAVGSLQIKVGTFELGNIAKFLRNLGRWFNVGVPAICGSVLVKERLAEKTKEVTIRLTRSATGFDFATIVSSTEHSSEIEAARLAAERAAYKLLYLFAHPECSSTRVDGLAARRQGIDLLQRYVTSGLGDNPDRVAALEKAVHNLRFAGRTARTSAELCQLQLFEAVALVLLAGHDEAAAKKDETAKKRAQAIELLRSVQDLADLKDPEQAPLRLQALYNQAVLAQRENTAASTMRALRLYQLLLDDADKAPHAPAVQTIVCLGRFGYLTAAAAYPADDWRRLVQTRADEWMKIADTVRDEIYSAVPHRPFDERVSDTMALETHQAYATLVVKYIQTFSTYALPRAGQPPSPNADSRIDRAASSLQYVADRQLPDAALYSKLVFAALLRHAPSEARSHACNALSIGVTDEIFYYAAAWGAFEAGDVIEADRLFAAYKDPKTIPEFSDMEHVFPRQPVRVARRMSVV
jgi:hypothetical protein